MRLSERLFEGGLLLPSERVGFKTFTFFPSSPSMIPDRFVSRFFHCLLLGVAVRIERFSSKSEVGGVPAF